MIEPTAVPELEWRNKLLDLDDPSFEREWLELDDDQRQRLGSRGLERIEHVSLMLSAAFRNRIAVQRITQRQAREQAEQARKPNGGGNGHNHADEPAEPPPDWIDEPYPAISHAPERKPLDWPTLAGQEPPLRDWAVQGWIGMGHVSLLVGTGGIGKSLIAQQIASCVALGHKFIDAIPRERKALMWACEDDHDEIWRRQLAISRWMRVGLEAYDQHLVIEPRHGRANTMISTEFGRPMITTLVDELAQQANDYHAELVIIDNAAQVYGANENDRHAVTMFLNALSGRMVGKAILLLAHPSRATGSEFSGSSAWENTARTRLYLGSRLPNEKAPDGPEDIDQDTRYLCRRKANYSDQDYRRLSFANGVLYHDMDDALNAPEGAPSDNKHRSSAVVMDGLLALAGMGVRAVNGRTSPSYLPRLLIEFQLHHGLGETDLSAAMRQNMKLGRIKRAVIGKYSNRTPIVGLIVAGTQNDVSP